MVWELSYRADPAAREVADRHYNRQSVGAAQFVPPGRCLVLVAPGPCLWITSWPLYVRHAWPGAWMCSAFRREGGDVPASELIRQAVAATRAAFGDPPEFGMVTFVDRAKVHPTMRRGRATWGWTYERAGFRPCGETAGGLLALQLLPGDMPPPRGAIGAQSALFARRVEDGALGREGEGG